jgi:hypothetical protein
MKQIFWIIMIVVVVIFAGLWYANRSKSTTVSSGQVFVHPAPRDAKTEAAASAAAAKEQTAQAQQPAAAAATDPPAGEPAAPGTDSIRRNPPNGMTFAGTGKYQVYRQGDITWRLNTETGQSCVLFATDAEWRKPRVFQRGCGAS